MKRFNVLAAAFCILGVALVFRVVGPDTSAAESMVEIGKIGNNPEGGYLPWCDKDNEWAVTNTIVQLPVTGRARGSSPVSGTLVVTGNGLYHCRPYSGPHITWENSEDPTVTFPASSAFQPLGSFGVRFLCDTSDTHYSENFYVLVQGIDDTGQASSPGQCKIGMAPELVHLRVTELKVDRVNRKVTMKGEKTRRVTSLPWRIIAMRREPLSSGGVTELGSGYVYDWQMADNTFEVTADLKLGSGDYIITGSLGPDVPGWNTSEHMNGIRMLNLSNYRPAPPPQGSTVPLASRKPFLVGGQYNETGLKFSLRYTVCNVEEGITHEVHCDRFGCSAGWAWRNLDDMGSGYSSPRGGELQPSCPGYLASMPGVVEIAEGFRPARPPGDCEPVRYQITVTADPDGRAEQSVPLPFWVSPVGCNLPQITLPPPPDNPFPPFPRP